MYMQLYAWSRALPPPQCIIAAHFKQIMQLFDFFDFVWKLYNVEKIRVQKGGGKKGIGIVLYNLDMFQAINTM